MTTVYQSPLEACCVTKATDKLSSTPATELVLLENQQVLEKVSDLAVARLIEEIATAFRVFVVGEDHRSLALHLVAMRLVDLGCQVYIVGEMSTSVIGAGDLLIACSNSRSVNNVCVLVERARKAGARIVSVTTQANSTLGQMSHVALKLAIAELGHSQEQSQQIANFLFEQSTLLLFNTLFHGLTQNLHSSAEILALRLREKVSLETSPSSFE